MTTTTPGALPLVAALPAAAPPQVEVVVPVFNEQAGLAASVRRLHAHLLAAPYTWRVTIADNASTDGTLALARQLAATLPGVHVVHLAEKGRGRALAQVWSASDAQVLAYMDVDLSTDLNALLPLVAPLLSGHSDLAIGSRLARSARVARGPKRELISRGYNLLLHGALRVRFSDAQCGFKAIRADRARLLLPHVRDTGWFFDTELLVLAERTGLRISEVPVDWVDDPDSRVDLVATALADLRGVARVARGLAGGDIPVDELRRALRGEQAPTSLTGQVARFAAVGVASTLAYLLLYVLLRGPLGPQGANALGLLLTAVGNTAVNRRFTFGSSTGAARSQLQGLLVLAAALVLTSGSLHALHALVPGPARWLELGVLVLANLAATVLRFLLLRHWVFRRRTAAPTASAATSTGGAA
jgi:putative flippase GtrA